MMPRMTLLQRPVALLVFVVLVLELELVLAGVAIDSNNDNDSIRNNNGRRNTIVGVWMVDGRSTGTSITTPKPVRVRRSTVPRDSDGVTAISGGGGTGSTMISSIRTHRTKTSSPFTSSSFAATATATATTTSTSTSTTSTTKPTSIVATGIQQQRQQQQQPNKARRALVLVMTSSLLASSSYAAYQYRHVWLPFFDKEMIQQKVVSVLQRIQPNSDNASFIEQFQSIAMYSSGMMIWEFFGLSTIPVETAAGMVFPYRIAAWSSMVGKLMGATMAFILGRLYLQQYIQQHSMIQRNAIFQILLSKNNNRKPSPSSSSSFKTALCMKFSCFPELMKNFGSSCISSVSIVDFILVTILHGGFYTCIWTYLGYDTAQHMIDPSLPPNRQLQVMILMAMLTGFVITPLVMTWWVRDLQYHAAIASSKGRNKIFASTTGFRQVVQKKWQSTIRPQIQSTIQSALLKRKQSSSSSAAVPRGTTTASTTTPGKRTLTPTTTATISQSQQSNTLQTQQWFIVRLLNHRSFAEIWIILLLLLFIVSS